MCFCVEEDLKLIVGDHKLSSKLFTEDRFIIGLNTNRPNLKVVYVRLGHLPYLYSKQLQT